MEFVIVLFIFTALAWALPPRLGGRQLRRAMRLGIGAGFVAAGIGHLVFPEMFFIYFPEWVPYQTALILLSGIAEIVVGLALISGRAQREVGLATALFLVLVFPANVFATLAGTELGLPGTFDDAWYAWVRLPLQAVLIWWALFSTGVLPLAGSSRTRALPLAPPHSGMAS